jgi:hypothetical protein
MPSSAVTLELAEKLLKDGQKQEALKAFQDVLAAHQGKLFVANRLSVPMKPRNGCFGIAGILLTEIVPVVIPLADSGEKATRIRESCIMKLGEILRDLK